MTRIDFYLLPPSDDDTKHLAACRLAHKTYRLGHRTYILTATADESASLDQLLWTFSPGSFVPHKIYAEPLDPRLPVLIGHGAPPPAFTDVLISLAPSVPNFFERFARVAELVAAEDTERASARDRFRLYRDRGYPVQTHNL